MQLSATDETDIKVRKVNLLCQQQLIDDIPFNGLISTAEALQIYCMLMISADH